MPLDKISRSSAIIIRHLAKEFPSERLGNGRNGVHDIRRHKWFQVCLLLSSPRVELGLFLMLNSNVDSC